MTRVLIIGGGIGGLTAAVALRRQGLDAHVYEAAPALRPVGQGIWVPANAMQVLDRLGASAAVSAAGWPLERIQLRTASGGRLLDADLRTFAERYGHTTVSIRRANLVQILADALPPDALHLGKRCTGIEANGAAVVVHFDDNTAARGDVLVGADGIRSVVRERLFGAVPLRYSGQTCYRGIADLELPADQARVCVETWGGPARMGFSAVGPRHVYWFATVLAPPASPLPAREALTAHLAARYADFPAPIPEILRHTAPEGIIRTDLYDFAPLDRWSQGRVVLLGDAAHAMTPNLGQGGAQAIEDAYVLAEQLGRGDTCVQAFQEYQRLRLAKVRWVVTTARRIGQYAHLCGGWARLRNLLMKRTPRWLNNRQFNRLYALNY